MSGSRKRPDPVHWLWYALGGRLPHRFREWVLFDATVRTWPLRHFARTFVQVSLAAVPVVLVVPGPLWIRLVGMLLGGLVALQYALFTMQESVEFRVRRAGYPGGAQQVRDEADSGVRAAAAARYAERYRSGHP